MPGRKGEWRVGRRGRCRRRARRSPCRVPAVVCRTFQNRPPADPVRRSLPCDPPPGAPTPSTFSQFRNGEERYEEENTHHNTTNQQNQLYCLGK
ncbi:hypothetical protein VIGAN_06191900 [Vigna angularis var. angularis]|uniref:Uncharacterized protein n=1 Tax=Vigna angularis var. angularis TaxID=157739 RepID=A0A0S3SCU5_PHAAN|nr:hypothetical protein VIGAN_06191900 [Vigna angularis var. angularis]